MKVNDLSWGLRGVKLGVRSQEVIQDMISEAASIRKELREQRKERLKAQETQGAQQVRKGTPPRRARLQCGWVDLSAEVLQQGFWLVRDQSTMQQVSDSRQLPWKPNSSIPSWLVAPITSTEEEVP